jgi:phosphate transport system protein
MATADELPLLEGHISRSFDGDLAALQLSVTAMGALVLSQVQVATTAYSEWDTDAAQLVAARELQVNAAERQIDQDSLQLIARRQPMAHDLRAILSFERVVTDLERIGDEANKIARLVNGGGSRGEVAGADRPVPSTSREVRQLGRLAAQLVRAAVEAFDSMDALAAQDVIHRDFELDEEYAAGLRRLLTRAMEDPRLLQGAVQSAFVLKSIERIGDHARNVARQVVQLVGTARSAQLPGAPVAATSPSTAADR